MKVSEILKLLAEKKDKTEFLATGFSSLDNALDGGFLKKELVIMGGSTGIGKSYVSAQILFNIARAGYKTAYYSLEISNELVLSRLLGQLSDIRSTRILTGQLDTYQESRKNTAVGRLIALEDYIDFFDEVYEYAYIENSIKANDYEFVVIDFIQNVAVPGMEEYPKLSYVALALQKLAKAKNCCIMALSQLSNFVARDKQNPILEYKGSGSIATVADLGFFILRDTDLINQVSLILRKNRRGPSGMRFDFTFSGEGGLIS